MRLIDYVLARSTKTKFLLLLLSVGLPACGESVPLNGNDMNQSPVDGEDASTDPGGTNGSTNGGATNGNTGSTGGGPSGGVGTGGSADGGGGTGSTGTPGTYIDMDQDWSGYTGPAWGDKSFNGAGHPGTPATASGDDCTKFEHVKHLPWADNEPAECRGGDWCMKWDGDPNSQFPQAASDLQPGARTWFASGAGLLPLPWTGVAKIAFVTCKIGNQCLRFYGQNNCHYDLYDPDTNKTVKPPYMGGEEAPYAIKDGHDYMNFRVRLPGSNKVYNFMNIDGMAATNPYYARYCPVDKALANSLVAKSDPVEGNQALGCGPQGVYHGLAKMVGETRAPIPYPPPGRSDYDKTFVQPRRHEK
jgi:hypothetical protein